MQSAHKATLLVFLLAGLLLGAGYGFTTVGQRSDEAEPALRENALKAPAYDLAKSYLNAKKTMEMLSLVRAGASVTTPEGRITKENLPQYEQEYEQRLSIYAETIAQRGYKVLSGSYRARASKACGRIQSLWVGVIHEGTARDIEIQQEGFEARLHLELKESAGRSLNNPAIVVENSLVVVDAMNSDYCLRGEVKGENIVITPDESVLTTWPQWAKPPRKKDLKECTVTLEPLKAPPAG